MRKYTLAAPGAKLTVDLQEYQTIIEDAVHEFKPDAAVKVESDCYYVDPAPSQGEAIKIGRKICQSELKKYCIQIPKLFSSIEVEGDSHGAKKSKRSGGHF